MGNLIAQGAECEKLRRHLIPKALLTLLRIVARSANLLCRGQEKRRMRKLEV
jgi:hypothetical protein